MNLCAKDTATGPQSMADLIAGRVQAGEDPSAYYSRGICVY